MTAYRKKPVVIEATQWFKDGDHPAVKMMSPPEGRTVDSEPVPWIPGLEGGHVVTPGDWIITGVQGENYACKPDVFAATYELASNATPHQAAEPAVSERLSDDELQWEISSVSNNPARFDVEYGRRIEAICFERYVAASEGAASLAVPEGYKLITGIAYSQRYVSLIAPDGRVILNAYEQGAREMFTFLSAFSAAPSQSAVDEPKVNP